MEHCGGHTIQPNNAVIKQARGCFCRERSLPHMTGCEADKFGKFVHTRVDSIVALVIRQAGDEVDCPEAKTLEWNRERRKLARQQGCAVLGTETWEATRDETVDVLGQVRPPNTVL